MPDADAPRMTILSVVAAAGGDLVLSGGALDLIRAGTRPPPPDPAETGPMTSTSLSPQAVAAIRDRAAALGLDWAAADDAAVLAGLMADLVANPDPQGQVPRVLAESELLGLLTDPANGSLGKLLNWLNFGLLKTDIDADNHAGVSLWAQVLPALGLVTTAEAAAITNYATTPVPDPAWSATVPAIQATIGRPIDLADVAASRPQGA